nr:RecName: Full=Proline-rich peptide [Calliphora vicina]
FVDRNRIPRSNNGPKIPIISNP